MVHGATKSKKISDMAKIFLLTATGQRQLKTKQSKSKSGPVTRLAFAQKNPLHLPEEDGKYRG
jgi:hypothetical protein